MSSHGALGSKRRKYGIALLALLSVAVGAPGQAQASGTPGSGLVGSAHDFSALWNSGNNRHAEICVVCHVPHNADATVVDAPLWSHEVTAATYAVYSSPTLDATNASQPIGVSKLCLSCHDGTVALDAFDSQPGTQTIGDIAPNANLTTDLSDDHPISFTYDAQLAAIDGELFDPTVRTVSLGGSGESGTINDLLLFDGKVECSSCHDVHNRDSVDDNLLRITRTASAICLACHDK